MKDHKTKLKSQKIMRSICNEKGCKYKGQNAVQGVCFHALTGGQRTYVKRGLEAGQALVKSMRESRVRNKIRTDKQYIKYLEGFVIAQWANNLFSLDELVYLRSRCVELATDKKSGKKRRK